MADSISPTKDIRGQKTTEKKTRKANVSEVNKHGKSFQEKESIENSEQWQCVSNCASNPSLPELYNSQMITSWG